MKRQICEICGQMQAICLCDGCGRMLCADCECFEIWGRDPDEMVEKHFCAKCHADPEINPWGERDRQAGLQDLLNAISEPEDVDLAM